MYNWHAFFPYETPRKDQETAIEFALDAFLNQGKRYVICECATGVGKSAIAVTVARYLDDALNSGNVFLTEDTKPGAYFITTQKLLQEQYINDFGGTCGPMRSVKSSSNFDCTFFTKQKCSESLRMVKHEKPGSPFFRACAIDCIYKAVKREFLEARESVTNFPYLLAESQYAKKITRRNLLVIDEAHNAESQLSKFVEVSFSERFCRTFLNIEIPGDIHTDRQVIGWIRNEYMPVLTKKTLSIGQLFVKYAGIKEKLDELGNYAKQYEKLDKHMCKVNRFLAMYDDTNWVMNITTTDRNSGKKIEFKPVDVAPYAEPTLFSLGDKILMISATIMNKDSFCSSLGIDPAEAAFISMPSPFPKENRPVFFVPVGSMAMNSIDASLPALAQKIKEIIAIHKGEKGIIHAHSYKIASYIKKNVKSKRIILHDTENREEMLAKHISSPEPTILLSPSMTEGIDLKDDASRFQILCKVAYPYLGDPVIRKRMKKHAWWYAYATAKTMLQSMGRSVRNDTDHAVTYILDSDFNRFYSSNRNLFPADFDELLHRL